MDHSAHSDADLWRSAEGVQAWAAAAQLEERNRTEHRRFMAVLLPFEKGEPFRFLDLGAGTGAASRVILDLYPRSTAILADFSGEMLRVGADEMERFAGRYAYVEFDMSAGGTWPAAIPAALDAVVTSMSVHHLPDERKQSLFAEIFDHLVPGGWYLNYDPVRAEDPVVEATWQRVNDHDNPEAAARRHHPTPLEQARWEHHIRHIIPLGQQLGYLRSAGFEGIDVYFKQLQYVIYGGRRPVNLAD
jgi:tRNA (cmo5U34)-methyltransferase